MAHELSIRNGKAEMAYRGATPWHGLGTSADGLSFAEFRHAAGFDLEIMGGPVQYAVGGETRTYRDRVVQYRGDNGMPLAVVSASFKTVQPAQIFDIFSEMAEKNQATMETAGLLFDGRVYWALASIGVDGWVADRRDTMKRYLRMTTSCDGTRRTSGDLVDVRTVCNNTLLAGDRGAVNRYRLSHRSQFVERDAKTSLGLSQGRDEFAETLAEFKRMAETKAAPVDSLLKTAELFTPKWADMDRDAKIKTIEKSTGPVARIGQLFLNRQAIGSDLDGTAGTAYGWLNAVTEYVDHEGRARTADRRIDSAWFGDGAKIKERAREMALEMVDAAGTVTRVYVPEVPAVDAAGGDDFSSLLARPLSTVA